MTARYMRIEIHWGPGPHVPRPFIRGVDRPFVQQEYDELNNFLSTYLTEGGLSFETEEGKVHIPQYILQRALIMIRVWEEDI